LWHALVGIVLLPTCGSIWVEELMIVGRGGVLYESGILVEQWDSRPSLTLISCSQQTTVNIKSLHILWQSFKIFRIFIWVFTCQLMNMPSIFVVQHLVYLDKFIGVFYIWQ
jgi:hypothetical protein